MNDDIVPLDWQRMLLGTQPPLFFLEIALRILMLLALLLLVVHLLGKRGQQDLSPMQQMLMVALGAAGGDVMLYPDVPIAYAATVLVGVTLMTIVIEKAAYHSRHFRDYLESRPCLLVRDGVVNVDTMRRERTTRRELYANLRLHGAQALSQVEFAILEVTGEITVVLNDEKPAKRDLLDYLVEPEPRRPTNAATDGAD